MAEFDYIKYDPVTGQIMQHGRMQQEMVAFLSPPNTPDRYHFLPEGEAFPDDILSHYYVDVNAVAAPDAEEEETDADVEEDEGEEQEEQGEGIVLIERPDLPLPSSLSLIRGQEVSYSDLPAGLILLNNMTEYPFEGGVLELDTVHVGSYTLFFDLFPCKRMTMEVTVTGE